MGRRDRGRAGPEKEREREWERGKKGERDKERGMKRGRQKEGNGERDREWEGWRGSGERK